MQLLSNYVTVNELLKISSHENKSIIFKQYYNPCVISLLAFSTVCYGCMIQPTMFITKPSYRSLLAKSAVLVCTVISPNLESAQIAWLVDGKPSHQGVIDMVTTDTNGSQKLRSNHSVSLEQWTKGTIFACKVTGGCFEERTEAITIKKATRE